MPIELSLFKFIDRSLNRVQNKIPLSKDELAKIQVRTDIVYDAEDPQTCVMDTYCLPKTEGKYPVMIYIHGGGFVAGDKYYRRGVAAWYAHQGLFTFNINYGLCPKYSYPDPLVHVVKALNYIADHADEYELDMDKLMVSGDSAGAFYAAMLMAVCKQPAIADALGVTPKAQIGAAVLDCGLYDVGDILKRKMPFKLNEKIYKSLSGMESLNFDDYPHKDIGDPIGAVTPDFPPTFIIYAHKDMFVPGQAERLIEAYKAQNAYFECFHSKKSSANHCFPLMWKNKEAKLANALVTEFIKNYLTHGFADRPEATTENSTEPEADPASGPETEPTAE